MCALRLAAGCAWFGIVALAAAPAARAADTAPDDPAQIDRLLSKAFPSDGPGAAVLVVSSGQTVLRKGYGLADLELGVPADPKHVFRICSITKQFTAVAILQLVEAGKVRLEDPITKYLPDFTTSGAPVTVAQLLTHTAGVPSVGSVAEWSKVWRTDMSVADLLSQGKNKPLDFPPGTDFRYSNTGYVLLGAVIEKVSGQRYAEYVQTHLFAPAGMTSSCYDMDERVIPQRVRGYMREGQGWANAPYISMTQPYAAGGLLSTVDDLWRWEQALRSGKLISPASLAKAHTQAVLPDGRGTHYGFGWEVGEIGNHSTIEHGGGMPGFSAHEIRVADADLYVVILANAYDLPASPKSLSHRIAEVMLHIPAAAPATLPVAALQDFVGAYRVAAGASFIVTAEDGKLVGQLGPGKRPLTARGGDTFTSPGDEMSFTFKRDAAHHVDRVEVRTDGPGPSMSWARSPSP
jgi:CubicO group peptidase (beta-lactamase class C family)